MKKKREVHVDDLTEERLLLSFGHLKLLGIDLSRASINRLVPLGKFPRPVKTGTGRSGSVAWRRGDILRYIEELPETTSGWPNYRRSNKKRAA